jgi:hypothetical protein
MGLGVLAVTCPEALFYVQIVGVLDSALPVSKLRNLIRLICIHPGFLLLILIDHRFSV